MSKESQVINECFALFCYIHEEVWRLLEVPIDAKLTVSQDTYANSPKKRKDNQRHACVSHSEKIVNKYSKCRPILTQLAHVFHRNTFPKARRHTLTIEYTHVSLSIQR